MSNSSLVTVTMISPHSRPRTRKPDAILIHHMACKATAAACGSSFMLKHYSASTHYGIGYDGSVGLYVDESLASKSQPDWEANDRSIAIEVSNDSRWPNWHVPDVALEKLVELCVDICQRNGIERLNYTGDKSGNLLMHNWFQPTACPGPYLSSKFPWIAEEVNKRLGVSTPEVSVPKEEEKKEEAPISPLDIGDAVTLAPGARYVTGGPVPGWVLKRTLYVRKIAGDNITVSIFKIGAITGVIDRKYIQKNT